MWRRWIHELSWTPPKVLCHPPIALSHPRWWLTFAQTPSWLSPIVLVSPTRSNCLSLGGCNLNPQPQLLMSAQSKAASQQQGQVFSSLMSLLGSDNPILILIFTDISIRLVSQQQHQSTTAIQQQQQQHSPSNLLHCQYRAPHPALLLNLRVLLIPP